MYNPQTNKYTFIYSPDVKISNGYKYIKNIPIHDLIYLAYKGEIPNNKEINHINFNRGDNNIENLELTTH